MFDKLLKNEKFHSVEIDVDEFKKMIQDFVNETYPGEKIADFEVEDDGVKITLDSGEEVEIGIDWNEFIIR